MKTRKTKELNTSDGLYLLKKEEMRLFRGGNCDDYDTDVKDQILE